MDTDSAHCAFPDMQNEQGRALKILSLVFLVFAVFGLVIRLINIGNPLNSWDGLDEMNYALIARSLMSGELPYHGAFDHKPIALYYIFSLFFWVFGYTLTALRIMPLVAISLTSALLYLIARRRLPARQHFAALCAIMFMAMCTSFGNGGQASNTEILQLPILAGWWLAAVNVPASSWRRPLLLGALAGLAAQVNYLGGFVLALSTVLMLAWPLVTSFSQMTLRSFATNGIIALGAFVVVVLLMLAPLIVAGDLPEYFNMQRGFLSVYQGVAKNDKLVRAVFSVAFSAGFFVALLGCIVWCEKSWRGINAASPLPLAQLAAVFALTLFAIVLTGRLYPHYFNLLVVPSTLILLSLLSLSGARALRGFAFLSGILAALLVARGAWDVYLKDWNDHFRQRHEIGQLTAEIRSRAQPGERVLLLDLNHVLYFLADVVPATRFVFRGQIFADRFLSAIGSSPAQEIVKALEREPVFVMVCFDDNAAAYRALLKERLAGRYREYILAGYEECHDLTAYSLIAKNASQP